MINRLKIFVHIPKCSGVSFIRNMQASHTKEKYLWTFPQLFKKYALNKGVELKTWEQKIQGYSEKVWIDDYLITNKPSLQKVKYLFGHSAYLGINKPLNKKARYYTIIREPNKLTISLYNYLYNLDNLPDFQKTCKIIDPNNKKIDFTQWINTYKQAENHMTWFLSQLFFKDKFFDHSFYPKKEDAIKICRELNKFAFVGNLNNPDHISFLYKTFKIKGQKTKHNVSEKVIDEEIANQQLPENFNGLDYIIYNHFIGKTSNRI